MDPFDLTCNLHVHGILKPDTCIEVNTAYRVRVGVINP
jgi:hypothetical protein